MILIVTAHHLNPCYHCTNSAPSLRLLSFISAILFQHIGEGEYEEAPRERSLILNNMTGNNMTVFQFNFIVNNLRFDLIVIFFPHCGVRQKRAPSRLVGREKGQNW